ncbi:MAG: hypothetical protein LBF88_04875 [Planctomycetaceae bacterium]|jgi:hypothetical protein|nr:hypothetical protein [Planctomycetaceae bacterium]
MIQKYEVFDTYYHLHHEADGKTVLEIQFCIDCDKRREFSLYLNFEDKKLRKAAEAWWRRYSPDPVPETNLQAIDVANYHGIDIAEEITVEYKGTHYEIIDIAVEEKAKKLDEIW